MVNSRAKIAGPAVAAGAVSVGLILIGACGIGRHETYVSPPPLKTDPAAVVATVRGGTTVTAPKVIIPPSPSWQIAPAGPPRRPPGYTPRSSEPESTPRESGAPQETPVPGMPVETEDSAPTTRTRTSTVEATTPQEEPTTTRRPASTRPTTLYQEEE
ncbi:hypothetical protein [Nocardia sp. NPDC050710]|uniref:hypothetical protein n=1 Tax=Nocardia sp. NPDC050710 TaxID=3157220 RepID=UPI0033E5FA92